MSLEVLEVMVRMYTLEEFHFTNPREHQLYGRTYPTEFISCIEMRQGIWWFWPC